MLDPINDMVESFSNLMLMASVAFGIQKVLLLIGQYVYLKWLLMAVMAAWGLLYYFGRKPPRWLDQLFLLMLMVRFAIPLVTFGSDMIYTQFLQRDYQQGTAGLSTAAESVDATMKDLKQDQAAQQNSAPPAPPANQPPAVPPPSPGLWEQAKDTLDGAWQTAKATVTQFDPRPYLERLKEQASQATEHMINLIVVFLLRTVLVPLFLLWAMHLALKGVFSRMSGI